MPTIRKKILQSRQWNGDSVPFFISDRDPASKREILKAALTLFVHRGPSEPTVRQIAAQADYSNAVIFKYFPTKDKLAFYLFEQCWQEINGAFYRAVRPDESFHENLKAFLDVYARIVETDLDAFIYTRENVRRFCHSLPIRLRRQNLGDLLRTIFEKGKVEGEVAPNTDIQFLIVTVVGLISQISSLIYWKELRGSKEQWLRSLERTIVKIAT